MNADNIFYFLLALPWIVGIYLVISFHVGQQRLISQIMLKQNDVQQPSPVTHSSGWMAGDKAYCKNDCKVSPDVYCPRGEPQKGTTYLVQEVIYQEPIRLVFAGLPMQGPVNTITGWIATGFTKVGK